jgi:hypothetical protein
MTAKEIDEALASRGIHLDPTDEAFYDGRRRLEFDEVCKLLPDATDCEIAAWAEDRAGKMKRN